MDLPDGRTQHVTYHVADAYSGYVADIKYTGKAHHPDTHGHGYGHGSHGGNGGLGPHGSHGGLGSHGGHGGQVTLGGHHGHNIHGGHGGTAGHGVGIHDVGLGHDTYGHKK